MDEDQVKKSPPPPPTTPIVEVTSMPTANKALAAAHEREQARRLELQEFNQELARRVDAATEELTANNEQLERRLRELGALNSVVDALASVLHLDELFERIVELSKKVMNAEAACLLLLDKERGGLTFDVLTGPRSEALKPLTVQLGQGIAGTVAQTGIPLLIPDAHADPRFDPSFDEQSGFHTKSILAVPIKCKDELIGVIEVMNKICGGVFGDDDLGLFQAFASSAGVAWNNARLFEKTEAMTNDLREALEQERRLAIEKEKMGAYISKHVVDRISRDREAKLALGGAEVHATVLFADIKGFTKLSETLEPQEVISLLNLYMTTMTNIIEEEDGIIDKFMGDGIMAVFTPLDDDDNHAVRAVRAAYRMQQKMKGLLCAIGDEQCLDSMRMRVGINTGEMVAGNIGSETRMDYTVIGDNVNVAARLESVCEPGEIYISASTYEGAKIEFAATQMEPILVKNRVQPVRAFSIRPAERAED